MKKRVLGIVAVLCAMMAQNVYADGSTWLYDGQIVEKDCAQITKTGDLKRLSAEKAGWNRMTDYGKGYGLLYPSNMYADVSVSGIKDVVFDDDTIIEVYHDDFNGTLDSYYTYRNYSKTFKANTDLFRTTMDRTEEMHGRSVHMMAWEREALEGLNDDKPYYFSAEIKKSLKETYTIMVKSSKPISIGRTLVENFAVFEPDSGRVPFTRTYSQLLEGKSDDTEVFLKEVLDGEGVEWGLYHPGAPGSMVSLKQLEENLEYEFLGLIRYQTVCEDLPLEELVKARQEGKVVQLTMQLIGAGDETNQIIEVLNGGFDDYLEKYAESLKMFGTPVLFRLNNEMNGDWCSYNGLWLGKDTDLYKKAWIYIYDFMEKREVDNLVWVWNPNDESFPGFKWNHWMNYFPGEPYVDVIGLTGYNTGTYYKGEKWRTFEEIYRPLYSMYSERFDYPLIVSEFGSNSVGGDKSAWIRKMGDLMSEFERIHLYFWFSGVDLDSAGNDARVYRVDENEETLDAFRKMLAD